MTHLEPLKDADLDYTACIAYLQGGYNFDLLPNTPATLDISTVAHILFISIPSVQKLINIGELQSHSDHIKKNDLLKFLLDNQYGNQPLLDPIIKKQNPTQKKQKNLQGKETNFLFNF